MIVVSAIFCLLQDRFPATSWFNPFSSQLSETSCLHSLSHHRHHHHHPSGVPLLRPISLTSRLTHPTIYPSIYPRLRKPCFHLYPVPFPVIFCFPSRVTHPLLVTTLSPTPSHFFQSSRCHLSGTFYAWLVTVNSAGVVFIDVKNVGDGRVSMRRGVMLTSVTLLLTFILTLTLLCLFSVARFVCFTLTLIDKKHRHSWITHFPGVSDSVFAYK